MISDLAITDYSSVMFDFMLTKRPCLLYASDVEDYKKQRDFFVTMDSLPFPLAQNNAQLRDNILHFEGKSYYEKVDAFSAYHGFCDNGTASAQAANWILKQL